MDTKELLTVDLSHPVQENYLGGGAVYHGYAGMPDDAGRVYTKRQCRLEAERAGELGVKIVRTFYGWYAFENGVWDWQSERMNIFCNWVAAMKEQGIDVALQAGWCNPGDVNSTSWNGESPFAVEGDWQASVENYARWVSESVGYLVEQCGFDNVKYLLLFTEPQHPSGTLPEGETAYDTWLDCAAAVHRQLVQDGRRQLVRLVGPNEGSTSTSVMVKWAAEHADDYIDIYSSHNYLSCLVEEDCGFPAGECNACFSAPGARIQQLVSLKPHTEYEIRAVIRAFSANGPQISGNVLLGAFEPENPTSKFGYFTAGGEPTTRLNQTSVTMLDAVLFGQEWNTVTARFSSGDAQRCNIGLFNDIKPAGCGIYVREIALYEVGGSVNLLHNSDFSDPNQWFNPSAPRDSADGGWRQWAASLCASNACDDWKRWVDTALQYVPNNKEYWFDEYNILADKGAFDSPLHGTRRAQAVLGLMNAGAQSSIMWTLFDQQWPNNHATNGDSFFDGNHRYGVMPVLTESEVPYPSYYAVGLAFYYMGGGAGTRVCAGKGGDAVAVSVTFDADGNFSVLAVNSRAGEREFALDFGRSLGLNLRRHLYDPAQIKPTAAAGRLPCDKVLAVTDRLSDRLPSYGVAVYTTRAD